MCAEQGVRIRVLGSDEAIGVVVVHARIGARTDRAMLHLCMADELADLPVSRNHPAREVRVAGEDLVLRPTLVTDAASIADAVAASLPELRRFMPWAHREGEGAPTLPLVQLERLRHVEAEYFAGRELVMGLFGADGALRSMIGLHPRVALNPRGLEVGYWTPTPWTKKGLTTLGVRVAALYAFDKLGCDRLQVMHDEVNVASRGVIERCGFLQEGVLVNAVAPPSAELVAAGYQATARTRLWAHSPASLAAQPWVEELRARLTYLNLAGYVLP